MEKLSNASHFLDIGGLDKLRAQAKADDKGALKEVAKQFEGIFVQMLMKSMREANAVFESDSPFNSQYTKFYEQMRDQQMAVDMSQKGILGLADVMVQQLSPEDSPITPAAVLGGDKRFAKGDVPAMLRRQDDTSVVDEKGTQVTPDANPDNGVTTVPYSPITLDGIHQGPQLNDAISAEAIFDDLLAGKQPAAVVEVAPLAPLKAIYDGPRQDAKFTDRQDFIRQLMPLAEQAAKRLGTKPEVLIAQAALETGWGQKVVRRADGSAGNNLFNIKADRRWEGDKTQVSTLEFEHGVAVRQKADFRVYDSLEQSFNDFVEFLSTADRYADAVKQASRPASFVQGLQNAGYATDPQYADKVMRVMQAVVSELKAMALGDN